MHVMGGNALNILRYIYKTLICLILQALRFFFVAFGLFVKLRLINLKYSRLFFV